MDYQNCLLDSILSVDTSRSCRYSEDHDAVDLSSRDEVLSFTTINSLDKISLVSTTDGGCEGKVREGIGDIVDERSRPWLVFTAGTMGVGKGHVLLHLSRNKAASFPLDRFVRVDPDEFRYLILSLFLLLFATLLSFITLC